MNELLVLLISLNVQTVYLTFDDGPHFTYTPQVLQILKENNIQANFFLVGEKIKENPEIVRQIVKNGHGIGGHSMNHKELTKISLNDAKREILESMELVNQYKETDLFRFPYGSFNPALTRFVKSKGYRNIYWDIDTLDWKYKDKDKIYSKFKIKIGKGRDGAVILMHDVHPQSVKALKMIVKYLKDNGIKTKKLE
jgi:peptidoglycan/xylan/chitin deacetylase (PgdA/CDA1 family)